LRENSLKRKLNRKKAVLGGWITIGNEIIVETMAKMPLDFVVVDMEHSAIELPQAQNLIRIVDLVGNVPLVRVGENDPALIKRVMDAGAYGVIIPMINNKSDAVKAVEAVRYPPLGRRGVGLARAQGYGISFEKYKRSLASQSVVILQIEHIDAVRNLKSILSVDGVDGFIVGPYDLSGSMGRPGEFSHPSVKEALVAVMRVAKEMKAIAGIHVIPPDPNEVKLRLKQGYSLIAFSLDTLVFQRSYEKYLKDINLRRK